MSHVTRPGDLTLYDLDLKFLHNVLNRHNKTCRKTEALS